MRLRKFGRDDDLRPAGADTIRVWMSNDQWLELLERVSATGQDRRAARRDAPDRRADRFFADLRCMLRIDDGGDHIGIFGVRSRNLGERGIGFVHTAQLEPGVRCALAIEGRGGCGVIAVGRVVWRRRLDEELYDTGVEFDHPIDVRRLIAEPA